MWLQKVVMEFGNCFNVCEGKIKANRPLAVISFLFLLLLLFDYTKYVLKVNCSGPSHFLFLSLH